MTRDEIQEIAWRDFINYAWLEPQMRQAFESTTKLRLHLKPTNSLEALIDTATGAQSSIDGEYMKAFVAWVTVWHWGLSEAPVAYQKEFAEMCKKGLAFPEPQG